MAVQNLDKEEGEEAAATAPKKKSSMGKIIIILVSVLVLAGGGAGAYFYFGTNHAAGAGTEEGKSVGGKGESTPKAAPVYYAFDPAFVVNFQDNSAIRFLQVTIEVMSRDPLVIEAVKTHMPVLRNSLVLLFSSQSPENIMSREGKEKIRADALKEIQKVMKEQTGSPGVEAVYFTGFVMQ